LFRRREMFLAVGKGEVAGLGLVGRGESGQARGTVAENFAADAFGNFSSRKRAHMELGVPHRFWVVKFRAPRLAAAISSGPVLMDVSGAQSLDASAAFVDDNLVAG
jgi:hypothetical protein